MKEQEAHRLSKGRSANREGQRTECLPTFQVVPEDSPVMQDGDGMLGAL